MSGTVSTPFNLMNTEIVDNGTGAITAGRVRDVVETLAAIPIYGTTETASFNVTSLDMRGTMVLVNAGSGVSATLPSNATTAFQVGTLIYFRPIGVGMITFAAGSGATVNNSATGSLITRAIGSVVKVHKTSTNTWYVDGDLAFPTSPTGLGSGVVWANGSVLNITP